MKNSIRSTVVQESMAEQEKELLKYEAPQIHSYTQAEIFEMMPVQGCTGSPCPVPDDGGGIGDILG